MRAINRRTAMTVVGAACCSACPVVAPGASPDTKGKLTDEDVSRFQELLRPKKNELWRTIPWHTALLGAQKVAAQQGKPLFIWAMDGHPLGCT